MKINIGDTIYYQDELNDDFLENTKEPPSIDKKYKYIHKNPIYKLHSALWYRILLNTIVKMYMAGHYHHKIVGKEKLKPFKKRGYFMYGNHTLELGDALIPNVINAPKRSYVVISKANLTMPVIGKMLPFFGGLPLPDDLNATKNFLSAIEQHIKDKKAVVIYPEAHTWPFYTGIRPFGAKSFKYPVKYNVPTFAFTNTYHKTKRGKIKIVTYIDGPFYPKEDLGVKENQQYLRDQVYDAMQERSKNNTCEYVKYIQKI